MGIRLVGLSRAVFELFPPGLELAYLLVTSLGDVIVVMGLLALLYWWRPRRRATATVVGYGFVAFGAVVALKSFFALPRPPGALIAAHGYGFPSGHATAAATVYGGLALEYDWLDEERKAAGVAVLVVAIALSRVALRVHYLGDVVAGLALGALVVAGTRWLAAGDPRRTFAVATVLALPALYFSGASPDAWSVLGGSLGGVVATTYLDGVPDLQSRAEGAALTAVGLVVIAVAKVGVELVPTLPAVPALDELVIVVAVLLLPLAFERAGVRERLTA